MRILHISTSCNGGAGNAALRLHQGLMESGIHSDFLCLYGSTDMTNVHHYPETKINRILRKIVKLLSFARLKNRSLFKRVQSNSEVFSLPNTTYKKLHNHPLVKSADIINLHWVAQFIDHSSFFKRVDKPIVWTLHDMNTFRGAFHYLNDEQRNLKLFGSYDRRILQQKLKSYQNIASLHVVAPSKWLLNESSSSSALGRFLHSHIPNSLNTEIFKPYPQNVARDLFGLPRKEKIVLFVSDVINNPRKGYDLLLEAIEVLPRIEEVTFMAIGRPPEQRLSGIHYIGRIMDERLMALAYSAADAFVLPSREDNLPNVMIESLCCGTPVISFPVGGMLDVLNENNGVFATDVSSSALAEAIKAVLENLFRYDRVAIASQARKKFDLSIQANKYRTLYQTINRHPITTIN